MDSFWQNIQINWWSNSNQFLSFWLWLIIGVIVAQFVTIPNQTLLWLGGAWLLIYASGQQARIEFLALGIAGLCSGLLLWQATGGETWLHLDIITKASDALVNFRDRLVDTILPTLPEPQGSLLTGILLGNRVKLDKELITEFRSVGLSHIIAVSGYNLTILIVNIRTLFRPFFGRQVFWFCLAIILGFVIITGAPASILRAGLMVGLALYAQYLGRPAQPLRILILSAGFLTLFQPKLLFDVGFQLSLAATYGLLRLSPLIALFLTKRRVQKEVAGVTSETLAAFIMTAPILLVIFERLSLISPLTNLLVVPLVPLLMTIGLLGLLLAFIWPALGSALLTLAWPILTWIVFVGHKASNLRFASSQISLSPFWALALLTGLIISTEYLCARSELGEKDNS